MYALIFVMLLLVLAGITFMARLHYDGMDADRHSTVNMIRMTAQEGAQIFNACGKESSPGVYSVPNLIAGGYLPSGYATSTPLGPQWVCQVSSGGVNGGNVVLVMLDGLYTTLDGTDTVAATASQGNLQTNLTWDLVQEIAPQVLADHNAVVGVISAGSTTMTSVVDDQQYNLSGLVNAPSYVAPVIAQNLVASTLS